MSQSLSITAEQDSNSSLIHIRVGDQIPTTASNEANAVAASLLTWDEKCASSHLNTIIDTLQGQIKSLDAQIAAAKAGGDTNPSDVSGLAQFKAQQTLQLNAARALSHSAVGRLEIVTPAQTPLRPVEPRPKLAAMIAALLALVAAHLVTFLRSALDSRYHSVNDLGRDLGLTVLGEFPTLRKNASLLPREPVNFLRKNLSFAMTAMHPKVMLVTSAESGDAKTTLAMNLAEAYARNDYRTFLIDADLRKPDVGRMLDFQPEGAWNLLELLRKPRPEMTSRTIDVNGVTFDVLPTAMESSRATELLSRGFKQILRRIYGYDVIVIDSALILPVADSLEMATFGQLETGWREWPDSLPAMARAMTARIWEVAGYTGVHSVAHLRSDRLRALPRSDLSVINAHGVLLSLHVCRSAGTDLTPQHRVVGGNHGDDSTQAESISSSGGRHAPPLHAAGNEWLA